MGKAAVPKIQLDLTAEEIKAVVSLTEDQLFRVKFIDPNMPGHKANPDQVRAAESALHRLKAAINLYPTVRKVRPPDIHLRAKY